MFSTHVSAVKKVSFSTPIYIIKDAVGLNIDAIFKSLFSGN